MVTKESLVTSRAKSEQLHERTGHKKTVFAWYREHDKFNGGYINHLEENFGDGVAAFTVPELLELLPKKLSKAAGAKLYQQTLFEPDAVADYVMSKL